MKAIDGGGGVPGEPEWTALYGDDMRDVCFANEQWDVIVREMADAGTLSVANGHALERLVMFRVQYERAARHVAEYGLVFASRNARNPIGARNPYWTVMHQAESVVRSLEAELGIAPARRNKAKPVHKRPAPRAADAYLRPVPRAPRGA